MYVPSRPAAADKGVEAKVLLMFCGCSFRQKLLLQARVQAFVAEVVADVVQLKPVCRVAKIKHAEVAASRDVDKVRDLTGVVVREPSIVVFLSFPSTLELLTQTRVLKSNNAATPDGQNCQ